MGAERYLPKPVVEQPIEVIQTKAEPKVEQITLMSANSLELRQNAYMTEMANVFADNYGNWINKQDPIKQARIRKKANAIKHGLASLAPVRCQGPSKCPWFSNCPIPDDHAKPGPLSDYPINDSCVLEVEYVAQQTYSYMTELKVDPTNAVEMSLIQELALLDLLRNRAVMILSNGDSRGQGRDMLSVDEHVVGWDNEGNALTNTVTKEHPAVGIMDKHERRRQKILDKFMATREAQLKVFGGSADSNSKLLMDVSAVRAFLETAIQQGATLQKQPELEDFDARIV